jgi:hypothetical protein
MKVEIEVEPNAGLYLRECWIEGKYGGEQFYISSIIGGATIVVSVGDKQAVINLPVQEILDAVIAQPKTEPVSPRIQAKTDAILSSGGTISAESGKPMEIVQAAQDSVNEKLNGGESNE